jgi:hypothetical protein
MVHPKQVWLGFDTGKGDATLCSTRTRCRLLREVLSSGSAHSDPIRRLSSRLATKQDAGRELDPWNLCNAQIYVDYFIDSSRNVRWGWALEVAMQCSEVAPSCLPSLFLPCPHCGHRMVITAVEPAFLPDGATANDLQDVTHGCEQCGTELSRIMRPLASAA